MSTYKNLMTVCCAAVLALGLAACGSSSDNANGNGDDDAPPPPAAATPMPVSMNLELSDAEQAALRAVLLNTGDSDMLHIAANMSETRADVEFSCASDYACTVTLTNNLGDIVATWSSQALPDATAPTVTVATVQPSRPAQRRARSLAERLSPLGDTDLTTEVVQLGRVAQDTLPAFLADVANLPNTDVDETVNFIDNVSATAIDEDGDADTDSMFSIEEAKDTSGTDYTGNHFVRKLPGGAQDHVIVFSNQEDDATESFAMAYGGLGTAISGDSGNGRPAENPNAHRA